jgi:Tfp pilus assembly protein PilF
MINLPRTNRFFCLIIALLSFVAFSNSFENSFQYDDLHVILKNPYIKDPGNFLQFFLNPYMGSGFIKETSGYRPVLMATFAMNYSLGGLNVFGYHLINFLIHTLSAILIYFITLFFLRKPGGEGEPNPGRSQMAGLFAALIFAVHPVQTESVTYITGRSSSLIGLFFLGSFWAYLQYGLKKRVRHLFLSSFSYAFALLVKETAITLPVLLILFNSFFPLQRTWKRRLFSILPHFLLTAIYFAMRIHLFGSLQNNSPPIRPLYDQLLTQLRAWVHYLGTLLVPLNLNVDYDFAISHSFLEPQVILSVFILALVAMIIWKISKSIPAVGFFALWFTVTLLPTSSVIPLEDVITDRWLYLPSVGYAVILALVVERIFRAKVRTGSRAGKLVFFFLCALMVELYGVATLLRNFTWTTDWTLWEDAAAKSPNKSRPHIGLGLAMTNAGHIEEAIGEFKKAIQLDPEDGRAYLNLGYIYFRQGKLREAAQAFKKAMTISPRLLPECHNNLGMAHLRQGRIQEAIKEFQNALEIRPLYSSPYFNLAGIYDKQGDVDRAISCLEKITRFEPEFFNAHKELSRLYNKKGWKEKSQEAYRNYLKYAPWAKYLSAIR